MTERKGQLFFLGGVIVLLLLLLFPPLRTRLFPPILANDIRQPRHNVAMHIPRESFTLNQTFTPQQNGLQEIELLLVRYSEPDPNETGRLTLSLYDETEELLLSRSFLTRNLTHNQLLPLPFPPESRSAGREYRLEISGSADNPVTVWGYSSDSYTDGAASLRPSAAAAQAAVVLPEARAADMHFQTTSRLTWRDVWWSLLTVSWYQGYLLPIAGALLLLPGALLLRAAPLRRLIRDPAARGGTAVALGAAVWPLLWQFSTLLGWRWSARSLLILLGTGWAVWLGLLLWQRRRYPQSPQRRRWQPEHAALLLLLIVALALRLLAVRDLTIPLWVDASRHGLITAVMAGSGQTISSYAPYLPVDSFPYHYGFHTLAAALLLISGAPLPDLLLYIGQLLNALLPLTVYAGLWIMLRSRRAALLAAFLVALPFFFPAYYATWGRFTQLTALLLLPPLLALVWQISRGGRRWQRSWWAAALLAAGLFLVHIRIFAYFLPFVPLVWLAGRMRHTRTLLLAGGGGLLLALPRLLQLAAQTEPGRTFTSGAGGAYFQFPTSYYLAGWDRYFIWLAGLLLILLLAALLDRRRWSMLPLVIAGWVLLQFLLVGGGQLGYPIPAFLNLNSVYISLFLPLAIYLAALAAGAARTWRRWPEAVRMSGRFLAGLLLTLLTLFGIQQQITIINPVTVLAFPADRVGIAWLDETLPADARIAVNSWSWLNGTWAGSDGGAWILPLTGRQTSTPPADYAYDADLAAAVRAFNEEATAVTDWSTPEAANWLADGGWTHVFVGAKGGFFDPAQLAQNPQMSQLYAQDGVFVFRITGE